MRENNMFCNPVVFSDGKRHTNPDPYILRWCGNYYCYATDESGVKVSISENLTDWSYEGYAIKEDTYRNYWAPSVIYINGTFYMYYSNVPAESSDCHEECLKLAISDRPEGPFVWKKTFFEKFSIDSHPVMWNGKQYMFYSVNDWIGTDEKIAGTCILVDEMVSPEQFAKTPRKVILPTLKQEIYEENRFGDGRDWYTIEGAAPIVRGQRFWLLYSANAYVNEDYFVGTTVADSKDRLMDMNWKKYPSDDIWYPLLKKNEMVEGTGHNTVEKAPNMLDDWIIYHGRKAEEILDPDIEQREIYIEPLYFSGDKVVCFGPSSQMQESPGNPEIQIKNAYITEKQMLCPDSPFYIAEFWISAQNSHAGMRYGILTDYKNENNYLEIQICSGKNEVKAIQNVDGIKGCVLTEKLEQDFEHTVPHLIRIEKKFHRYELRIDYAPEISFEVHAGDMDQRESIVGIISHFSKVRMHSFTLTRGVVLEGKGLQDLGKIYCVSPAVADKDGLRSLENTLKLEKKCEALDFTEEFQIEAACASDNSTVFKWNDGQSISIEHEDRAYSVYYIRRGGREWLIADGKKLEIRESTGRERTVQICLTNSKITEYRFAKN